MAQKEPAGGGDPKPLRTATPLPLIVKERLKSLKVDVVQALLDQHSQFHSGGDQNTIHFTPNLQEMAEYYFARGGKLLRPTVCLLLSNACNQQARDTDEDIHLNQYRIAMVSEMIHTASLIHDDVIDESDLRRGCETVNARWGNKQAVLVGDYILGRATKILCSIGRPKVISTMAEIVEDLVKGELMQQTCPNDMSAKDRFQHYMLRTFYKTASLFANSCVSVAVLSGCDDRQQAECFEFGRNVGLAFQLTDDLIDFTSPSSSTGKPALNDIQQGLATCPTLLASQDSSELRAIIRRRFRGPGDTDKALEIVMNSDALQRTRDLAKEYCNEAIAIVRKLPNGERTRDCLIELVEAQSQRDR